MSQAQATKEVDKFTISVTQPEKFPSLLKGCLITSTELMEKVSDLFQAAYKDYVGCYICPRANGFGFEVKLYFCAPAIDNEGATYAFETINNRRQETSGIVAGLVSLETRSSAKIYSLTQHGMEGLRDFLPVPDDKKVNWKDFVFEEMQNSNINAGVYAVVKNLDINKILSTIYGAKEDGEWLQYLLTPIRPLAQANTAALDWLLSLQRLSVKELNTLSRKVGMIQTGGIPMVGRHDK